MAGFRLGGRSWRGRSGWTYHRQSVTGMVLVFTELQWMISTPTPASTTNLAPAFEDSGRGTSFYPRGFTRTEALVLLLLQEYLS